MIPLEDLPAITKAIKFLTWKKLSIIFVGSIILCLLILLLESVVSGKATYPMVGDKVKLLPIKSETKDKIHEFIKKQDSIAAVRIFTLNYQHNIRIQTFDEINSPGLKKVHDLYLKNRIFNEPIFSSNQGLNNSFLQLEHGKFICVPFKETQEYLYEPEAGKYISSSCSLSIPPYNDGTLGIIVVYFAKETDQSTRDRIFLFLRDTSISIFDTAVHG